MISSDKETEKCGVDLTFMSGYSTFSEDLTTMHCDRDNYDLVTKQPILGAAQIETHMFGAILQQYINRLHCMWEEVSCRLNGTHQLSLSIFEMSFEPN